MGPKHLHGWEKGKPFPPSQILNPKVKVKGLWVGSCVFCGGSLGGPYQEDLFHLECLKEAEDHNEKMLKIYFSRIKNR